MKIRLISLVAMCAALAFAGCKSETGGAGGDAGSGGAGGGSGGTGGAGATGGTGGTGGVGQSCYDCACTAGGACALVCDDMGAGKLNFCTKGDLNGSQCGSCVATNCDAATLAECGM